MAVCDGASSCKWLYVAGGTDMAVCLCLASCLLSCLSGVPSMFPFKLLADKVSFNVALVLPTLQLVAVMKQAADGKKGTPTTH